MFVFRGGTRLTVVRIFGFEISKPQVQRCRGVSFEIRKFKIMAELPPEDREIIDADHDETLIIPIAEILFEGDRAWYTKDQINIRLQQEYNQDVSNPTISTRLDRLLELELIERKRIGQTDIFYYFRGSEWPIPPDVEVEPVEKELTVNELFTRTYVLWASIAIIAIIFGGIIIWIGTFQFSNTVTLPWSGSDTIALGLLTFFVSYGLLLMAIIVGLFDFATEGALPRWLT